MTKLHTSIPTKHSMYIIQCEICSESVKNFTIITLFQETYSLVTLIPLKIISLSSNTQLQPLFPLLEALFEGCLLSCSEFICCIHNDVLDHLKSSSQGHDLPRTLQSAILWEMVHHHDADVMFLQSPFSNDSFTLHPSHTSEPPYSKNWLIVLTVAQTHDK